MEKVKKIILLLLLVGFLSSVSYWSYQYSKNKETVNNSNNKNTTLCVVNSTNDSVLVYLTLGADTNFVTNVNRIFGIPQEGLQGYFYLGANDTVSYQSSGKGFGGNITFGTPPMNCADTNLFPTGINIFEFALNDNFASTPNGQETVDNSCVAGVNAKIICHLSDSTWNDGDSTGILSFENSYLYSNTYRIGVFPYGCDSCTVIKAPPICTGHKPFAQPQKKNICNIQRNATLNGGKVYVIYAGVLSGEVLK